MSGNKDFKYELIVSVTDPVASIFSPGFRKKKKTGLANLPPDCHFLFGRCFTFFKHTQTIYAECVKVSPGEPKTGRVKFNISPRTVSLGRVSLGLLQRGETYCLASDRKESQFFDHFQSLKVSYSQMPIAKCSRLTFNDPQTDSPNKCPYIFLQNYLREFAKFSTFIEAI